MSDLRYSVEIDSRSAVTALTQIQDRVDRVTGAFDQFNNVLGSLALAGAIAMAAKYADAIQDVSDATGIAADRIMGFSEAMTLNGGSSEQANSALTKFIDTIDSAAQGSGDLQNAFKEVGVSLKDLSTLSEQELFEKTIAGLGKISDLSRQAALAQQLLGKSVKGTNIAGVIEGYSGAAIKSREMVAAQQSMADAVGQLDQLMISFKNSMLKILKPVTDFINTLTPDQLEEIGQGLAGIVVVVGSVSAAFTTFATAAPVITAATGVIIGAFEILSRAMATDAAYIKLLGEYFKITGQVAFTFGERVRHVVEGIKVLGYAFAETFAVIGNFAIMIGRVIIVAVAAVEAIRGLADGFTKFGFTINGLVQGIARLIENLGDLAATVLNFPTDALAFIINLLAKIAGTEWRLTSWVGLGDWLKDLVKQAREEREAAEQAFKDQQMAAGGWRQLLNQAEKNAAGGLLEYTREVRAAQDEAAERAAEFARRVEELRYQIAQTGEEYSKNTQRLRTSLNLQAQSIGLSEDELELQQALDAEFANYQRTLDQLKAQKQQYAAIGTAEQRATISAIDKEIRRIKELYLVRESVIEVGIKQLQNARTVEQGRINDIAASNAALEKLKETSIALGQTLAQTFKDTEVIKFNQSIRNLTQREQELARAHRESAQALREKIQAQAALYAVEEGDFMTPESQARLAAAIDQTTAAQAAYTNEVIRTIEANHTWSAGVQEAFKRYREAAEEFNVSQDIAAVGFSTIGTAIDQLVDEGSYSFSKLARSMIKDMTKIILKAMVTKAALAAINGNFGSFIGGLFGGRGSDVGAGSTFSGSTEIAAAGAEGGIPKIGKLNLVGEDGPELFIPRMPGRIIPNDALSKIAPQPVSNTVNNYNVNAIDAQSVARFFAQHRQLALSAVTQAKKDIGVR